MNVDYKRINLQPQQNENVTIVRQSYIVKNVCTLRNLVEHLLLALWLVNSTFLIVKCLIVQTI